MGIKKIVYENLFGLRFWVWLDKGGGFFLKFI